ncbi:MAG: hypothetical protein R3D98_09085 [Candidatus Krumholzibacteriia bacterium]
MMLVLLAPAIGAAADIIDWALSAAEPPSAAEGASMYVTPNGGGSPFTEAFLPGGGTVDATVTVTLLDPMGDPVVQDPVQGRLAPDQRGRPGLLHGRNLARGGDGRRRPDPLDVAARGRRLQRRRGVAGLRGRRAVD